MLDRSDKLPVTNPGISPSLPAFNTLAALAKLGGTILANDLLAPSDSGLEPNLRGEKLVAKPPPAKALRLSSALLITGAVDFVEPSNFERVPVSIWAPLVVDTSQPKLRLSCPIPGPSWSLSFASCNFLRLRSMRSLSSLYC